MWQDAVALRDMVSPGGGHIHGRRATDGIRTLSDETVGGPESNGARG